MALSSMTGFARSAFDAAGAPFAWELRSVNGRGLEVRIKLPAGLDHLEGEVRNRAREALKRGTCHIALQREAEPERGRLSLNEEALALVVAAARRLAAVEGIAMPSADGILAIPGVLQASGADPTAIDGEARDAAILDSIGTALAALMAARQEEGGRLQALVEAQIATVERLVAAAAELALSAPEVLRARIAEQVAMLTAESASLDPDRLHQEAVLLATRADVREEIDRLSSHVVAARALLKSGDAVGRRLEFLAQEFNREANTLCSKSFDARLTEIGVELKAVIDQFREQVQNLE